MGIPEDKLPGGRLRMIEVADAEPLAGDLFRRLFHFPPPDYPRHFVAMYEPLAGEALTLGYIHFTRQGTVYLGGGMAFDERLPAAIVRDDHARGRSAPRRRAQVRGDFTAVDNHEDADWQVRKARDLIELICPNPGSALFAYPFGHTNGYLLDEYFPGHEVEHRTLAAVTCEPVPVTRETSRWKIPRYVFGVDWKDARDLGAILRE